MSREGWVGEGPGGDVEESGRDCGAGEPEVAWEDGSDRRTIWQDSYCVVRC